MRTFNKAKLGQKKSVGSVVIMLLIILGMASLANAAVDGRTQYYHVRQEIVEQPGILISRPHELDRKLMNVLHSNQISNAEEYVLWLEKNINYQYAPRKDVWVEPLDLIKSAQGDCEDFAALNQAALRILGFEPQFIALVGKGHAHAICVFKKDGYYVWFDNKKFNKTELTTFQQFAVYMTTNYKYDELKEFDPEMGTWKDLYKSS